MPIVKQLDWNKLTPRQPKRKATHLSGTKSFSEVEFVKATKNAKSGYIRKRKRTKLVDKTIVSEDISNINHLKSIMREEFR